MAPPHRILLTDNGSLRPEATFSLRSLATALGAESGHQVHPVSLLHSNRISPAKLKGEPAQTFEPFVLAGRAEGVNRFLVVPLFFGPSAAIAEYLPQRVDSIREQEDWPELEVRVAPCLVDPRETEDSRVATILADLVRDTLGHAPLDGKKAAVALVDHGSPRQAVTTVRNFLADQLGNLLQGDVVNVRPCSMERRDDPAYDFNEPLLERLLGTPGFDRDVVVSMLFLQPGRHAGPGGDVATICAHAEKSCPRLRTHRTELVGSHPALIPLLAERLRQGLDSDPVSWKAMSISESSSQSV